MALICDKLSLLILSVLIYCGNCALNQQLDQSSTNASNENNSLVIALNATNTSSSTASSTQLWFSDDNSSLVDELTSNDQYITDESIGKATYSEYYISDYCSDTGLLHEVLLGDTSDSDTNTSTPAIVRSHRNKFNTNLSNKTCAVKFRLPKSSWYRTYGLILSVQDINITNTKSACNDYLEIGANSSVNQLNRWCNNSDANGRAFADSNYLDIVFHASVNSTTRFDLVITPYDGAELNLCPSPKNLKCSGDGTYQCISKQYHCDGNKNCPKGNDEDECPAQPTTTTTTTTPTTTTTAKTTTTASTTTTTTTTPTPTTTPTTTKLTTTPTPTPTPTQTQTPANITTIKPSSSTTEKPDNGLSGGSIAGIVIGTIIGFLLLIIVLYFTIKKCKNRSNRGYSPLNE